VIDIEEALTFTLQYSICSSKIWENTAFTEAFGTSKPECMVRDPKPPQRETFGREYFQATEFIDHINSGEIECSSGSHWDKDDDWSVACSN
jgi:hypothetical protein